MRPVAARHGRCFHHHPNPNALIVEFTLISRTSHLLKRICLLRLLNSWKRQLLLDDVASRCPIPRRSHNFVLPSPHSQVLSMSTPQDLATNRSYPLSPTPNSEVKRPQTASFQPRTPQSPLQPGTASSEKVSNTKAPGSMSSTVSRTIQRSDMADAHGGQTPMVIDSSEQLDDISNKRKRAEEDTGDREQKKVHVEERKLCIEDLHLDVGKIYQLCRTRKTPFSPKRLQHCLSVPDTLHLKFCTSFTLVFG